MAANDLQVILMKPDCQLDHEAQEKLVEAVFKQLEDISGDISTIAVKCAGLLVPHIGDAELQNLISKLCQRCILPGKKGAGRDIAGMALKAVIVSISGDNQASILVDTIVPSLEKGIQAKDQFDVVNECLDLAVSVLECFGSLVTARSLHQQLLDVLLPTMADHRAALRKRTVSCLAALAVSLKTADLQATSQHLLQQLKERSTKPDINRTYLQALSALSRATGHRFGPYLANAVPLTIMHCEAALEGEEETLECGLQALETFVVRSPEEVLPTLEPIIATALRLINYDPNYDGAEDMDSSDADNDDEEEAEDELSEQEGYSDDDDDSWKVRRAAARTLTAIVSTFPQLLDTIYSQVQAPLLARFKEREEAVKSDIFAAVVALVHQVGEVSSYNKAPVQRLSGDAASIVSGAVKQLTDKSGKAKAGALQMLQTLVAVVPDCTSSQLGSLLPCLAAILEDTSSTASTIKLQALVLLSAVLKVTSAQDWDAILPALTQPLLTALNERYYKVAAQALRVTEDLVHTMRPQPQSPLLPSLQAAAPKLHQAVGAQLQGRDLDQEVTEASIGCTAAMVALLGDVLQHEVPQSLQVLLERTSNEVTRVAAVRGWAVIGASSLSGDLATVSSQLLQELTSLLRKSNRLLRTCAVSTLRILVEHHSSSMDPSAVEEAVTQSAALVTDADLSATTLALDFATTVLTRQPKAGKVVAAHVLPAGLALVASPLLQASALTALQRFFVAIVACSAAKTSFSSLLASLVEQGQQSDSSKSIQLSAARCIAALCAAATSRQASTTVKNMVASVQAGSDVASQRLGLLTLGEIGRTKDLSAHPGLQSIIMDILRDGNSSEDLRSAAGVALGGVTGGSMQQYLPPLLEAALEQMEHPKVQFLLLSALDGALSAVAASTTDSFLTPQQRDQVFHTVLQCVNGEEDVRGIAAECLGHTALSAPEATLELLLPKLEDPRPEIRAAASASLRAMVADGPDSIQPVLHLRIPQLLQGLSDSDRYVRRAALQSLSAVAHHKPALLTGQLAPLLPPVYAQTAVDPSLIRVVDLGPFKHRIDDGLETRKASFEAMGILLEAATQQIDKAVFLNHLLPGLGDVYDVKLPCHLLLARLAVVAAPTVIAALDRVVTPLHKTLRSPVKSDAVKQEVDRNEDMVRSCLRAVDAIACNADAENVAEWKAFMSGTVRMPPFAKKFDAVVRERSELPLAV